jgi:hypothetical protein
VLIVIVGAVGAVTAVFASEAISVRDDLMAAKSQISSMAKYVKSGDTDKIAPAGDKVLALTAHARDTVQGPLWSFASDIPLVGANVDAVRIAAEATHILATGAVPPGVEVLSTLNVKKLSLKGGGIDLAPLRKANEVLPQISAAFASAKAEVSGIDRKAILPVVDDTVGSLVKVMDDSGPMLDQVQTALPTLLKIAGADGKRQYMMLFQNNAEARATGGIPAATALVEVDAGHVKLAGQTNTQTFRRAGTAGHQYLDLTADTLALYEPDTFLNHGNFTRTPNFPTTAKAFDALWAATTGEHLDGVISLDPVVLSYLLKVTGPITLADGRKLTAANAVNTLLYDAYRRYPKTAEQDLFFSDVASRVFSKVASGHWNPSKMLTQLGKAAAQKRVFLWFTAADEQKLSKQYDLDGQMTTDNKDTTQVGIFLNDAAYSKLEYFLRSKVSVTCDAKARTITTTMSITNKTPVDSMTSYQLGIRNKRYGIPRDTFILDVLYFAPPGASIVSSDPAKGDVWGADRHSAEGGRNAASLRLFVPRGQTRTVSYTSALPTGTLGPVSVRSTPTVSSTPVTIARTCAALTASPKG